MNVLDENIIEDQRELLHRWRIRTRQIGQDIGEPGMKDNEHIIPLLHQLSRPTFFTRDLGFFATEFCHERYCLVCLAVNQYEVATFVRRLLRHAGCNTWAKRKGTVIRIGHTGIRKWRIGRGDEEFFTWSD
ncbi:MAG: hypothetical protein HYV60_15850 [Planctomycetia bacterium]|nr:hypothetical protein [Planctomycetia bacterium]